MAIGMFSFTVPLVGEFSDVVWAPLAGFLMTRMYKGTVGKVGGVVTFLEEIFPFSDVIPTFTLTWIYTYWIKNKNASLIEAFFLFFKKKTQSHLFSIFFSNAQKNLNCPKRNPINTKRT